MLSAIADILPGRDQPNQNPCQRCRRREHRQLAHQLPRRDGHAHHDHEHRLGYISILCRGQRRSSSIHVSSSLEPQAFAQNTDQPPSYFFYPETSHRSLEEIDFIFAKGYYENISYVKAAKEMPRLTIDDMEALAEDYGLTDSSVLKSNARSVEPGGQKDYGNDISTEEKRV